MFFWLPKYEIPKKIFSIIKIVCSRIIYNIYLCRQRQGGGAKKTVAVKYMIGFMLSAINICGWS